MEETKKDGGKRKRDGEWRNNEVKEYLSVDDRCYLLAFISVYVDASEGRKMNQIINLAKRSGGVEWEGGDN